MSTQYNDRPQELIGQYEGASKVSHRPWYKSRLTSYSGRASSSSTSKGSGTGASFASSSSSTALSTPAAAAAPPKPDGMSRSGM